jgi:hypothetical protein
VEGILYSEQIAVARGFCQSLVHDGCYGFAGRANQARPPASFKVHVVVAGQLEKCRAAGYNRQKNFRSAERNRRMATVTPIRATLDDAGTEVVWDVDTMAECIHVYRASDPEHPVTYRRGDTAEAEPAVPGWRVAVDWIFS